MEMPLKFLSKNARVPQLWTSAVVAMDNVPAHKIAAIEPLIKAVG